MSLEQFAYPFSLGMLAAFNPCGFAMLPIYLGFFIGLDSGHSTRLRAITRAMWVALVLTAGFVAVFGSVGVAVALFLNQRSLVEYVGYITVGVGIALIAMGAVMLTGRQISVRLPKIDKGTQSRQATAMFGFGVSYALISLSCTIGLFIQAVSNTFTTDGFADGLGSFLAYALGMGAVILLLTVSLARAKTKVADNMRRLLPYIGRISGAVLLIGGVYLIDYGIWDIRVLLYDDVGAGNLFVDRFLEFQAAVSNWITVTTPQRLGVVSLLGIASLLLAAWRDDHPDDRLQRRSLTALLALCCLVVEAVNDFDFAVLPLWRFVSNWPWRIGNWFSDPWRWGVILEVAFAALVVCWAWTRAGRWVRRRAGETDPART